MIDRARIQRIADRKVQQEAQISVCRGCNNSTQFTWYFNSESPTRTCRECGFVDGVLVDLIGQGEAA